MQCYASLVENELRIICLRIEDYCEIWSSCTGKIITSLSKFLVLHTAEPCQVVILQFRHHNIIDRKC